MKKAIVKLKSTSTYGQSKQYNVPKLPKELHGDYEERTWRERCHYDKEGKVFIPGNQFANSIRTAAKYANLQIPGKGKSTYTKHFESGIMVLDNVALNATKDTIDRVSLNVPSDGMVGGSKRVLKNFPYVPEWEGTVTYHILDDIITPDVFEQVLRTSGELIGIGFWRPRNRGMWGRFQIEDIKWIE
jgi:hypothetical protein